MRWEQDAHFTAVVIANSLEGALLRVSLKCVSSSADCSLARSGPSTARLEKNMPENKLTTTFEPSALDPSCLLSQQTRSGPPDLPFAQVASPAEVVDLRYLADNAAFLQRVAEAAGAKILLAQKAYSLYESYPLLARYLAGTTSSGLYEARLAHEEWPGGEIHVFSPAYREDELQELLSFADHLIFNTPSQWLRFRDQALAAQKTRPISFGLRLNPEYSEVKEAIYNPAGAGSRLGTTQRELEAALAREPHLLDGLSGFHMHTLCEDSAETFARTLEAFLQRFAAYIPGRSWLNFGGGHHITRAGYNTALLIKSLREVQKRFGVDLYLEPGEAVCLDCGWLVSTVLDGMTNGLDIALLDTSACCHMPDVLEMPYRPRVFLLDKGDEKVVVPSSCEKSGCPSSGVSADRCSKIDVPSGVCLDYEMGGEPGEKPYTTRLGGPTCLAGDIIGDYSFSRPLVPGDRLVFCDMALYSHVKRNSFNGMPLPALQCFDGTELRTLRRFDYEDFKTRLGG